MNNSAEQSRSWARPSFLSRLYFIITARDFQFSELQGSAVSIAWGLWIAWPHVTIDQSICSDLSRVMPCRVWGGVLLMLGLFQVVGLLRDKIGVRRQSAFAAGVVWLFIGVFVAMVAPEKVACPTSFGFAMAAFWGFYRMGHDGS